ncbi:hypothetical protein HG536_0C03230 [Torulaspora globosa]|uniref:Probable quinone oxidoreductase n=1 Tax=Torulaspora globosa TaxID=48254 RepID=A0A7G3ZF68_9SACH|nr:uncharacterized protein HG536_0C03230 [Torulaspora globosa]QLL32154.1 hypothetical protein HG536_0C03230 [Torulaspora globosa]
MDRFRFLAVAKRSMSSLNTASIPKTQKVVLINDVGDYDVLKYENYAVPSISDDEILIKNKFAGVNFIEAYFRKGIYPAQLPYLLGREATGVVVAKGQGVSNFEVGDKVGYLSGATFAQYTKYPAIGKIVKLPSNSSDEKMKLYTAALLQGLTALTFIHDAYEVKKDDYILFYAAAGGVGLIMTQLLKRKGAHTIAVVSNDDKKKLVEEFGAEYVINSSEGDILDKVLQITGGQGVDAVFDSVGKDTFETSLNALKIKGSFVSFGNASGPVTPFPLSKLSAKNIKLLRPQLYGYITEPADWKRYTEELLDLLESGELRILINKTYPLEAYQQAARDLESRKTTGKLVLEIPQ